MTRFKYSAPATRLPLAALLAFAMAGFLAILTETLPAGLLPQIGAGLGVSQVLAGQLVSSYALGSLLAAIPLTVWTRAWPRKRVLLTAVAMFLLFNTLTAISNSYLLTLVARLLAGVAAGLAWGVLAGYARRLVAPALQGKALAIAMVGIPLALALGTPLGTWMGAWLGWRVSFSMMAAAALLLWVWVAVAVPDVAGTQTRQALSVWAVLRLPGVRPVLAVILLWMTAHNLLYTFIGPFLELSGLAPRVGGILLLFGVAALLGIWVTGVLVDRHIRHLVLGSVAALMLVALMLALGMTHPWLVAGSVVVWGWSFGGASTQLQTAAADAAGEHADLVQAMVTTVWNLAIAAGGLLGGVLLQRLGAASFPWAILLLMALTLLLAWWAKQHAFKPGARATHADTRAVGSSR